jgi:hypothetical protein
MTPTSGFFERTNKIDNLYQTDQEQKRRYKLSIMNEKGDITRIPKGIKSIIGKYYEHL